ncbi:MAG: PQQ-binding-like beta-propeller repeat protein [Planctomycetaceae bacterium]|nr:PQQ-binding-like beta-propeller repeat protein [Planctomycetaceae bacterium]
MFSNRRWAWNRVAKASFLGGCALVFALEWASSNSICCGQDEDFATKAQRNWHQWRGASSDGTAPQSSLPTEWNETKNTKWKVELPGKGSGTPIVWEDRIYLMAAIDLAPAEPSTPAETEAPKNPPPDSGRGRSTDLAAESIEADSGNSSRRRERQNRDAQEGQEGEGRRPGRGGGQRAATKQQFVVLCLDRDSGKEVWRKTMIEAVPHEAGHNTNTFASASLVVDGQRIYANFGSRGFYCLDMQGEVVWEKDLGFMRTRNGFGEGSSPSVYGDTVVVPWDHEEQSALIALNAKTGEEKWRVDRDERTTWATPLITPFGDRVQVIVNGSRVRSYDLENGNLIWECGGQVGNPIPSPVRYGDHVICMTGYQGYAIVSMALDSQGDITDSKKVAWTGGGAAPYVPSPALYEERLYFVKSNNPVMVVRDVKTGKIIVDETRLPKMRAIYASPVAADGKIYFCSREGVVVVIKHGDSGEVLAVNEMGEPIDASPAIVGNQMFIRGEKHLYCITETN